MMVVILPFPSIATMYGRILPFTSRFIPHQASLYINEAKVVNGIAYFLLLGVNSSSPSLVLIQSQNPHSLFTKPRNPQNLTPNFIFPIIYTICSSEMGRHKTFDRIERKFV
ncbi:hypothetical protein VNO77_14755 [Canavalia gladiata]|uniref:Uncharacterized protein n=1 Tax=Canavalia gladiata TaxID=3824 RepID=A0AAN9QR37_CANGL